MEYSAKLETRQMFQVVVGFLSGTEKQLPEYEFFLKDAFYPVTHF